MWDMCQFEKLELIKTCTACPEQYELFIDGQVAGYLRLRHGFFRADFPGCGGETVYETEECEGDGEFMPEERAHYLGQALTACIGAWTKAKLLTVEQEEKNGNSSNEQSDSSS